MLAMSRSGCPKCDYRTTIFVDSANTSPRWSWHDLAGLGRLVVGFARLLILRFLLIDFVLGHADQSRQQIREAVTGHVIHYRRPRMLPVYPLLRRPRFWRSIHALCA